MKIRYAALICLSALMLLSSCGKADSSSETEKTEGMPTSVSLFGKEISLPCELNDLPDNIVYDTESAFHLNYTDAFIDIYDGEIDEAKSNRIGRIVVEDIIKDSGTISVSGDERISCINIENISGTDYLGEPFGRYDVKYGGFEYNTPKDDFKAKFGEPDYELDIIGCLIYYRDEEKKTFVQVDYKDDVIDGMEISLYDWNNSWINDENVE